MRLIKEALEKDAGIWKIKVAFNYVLCQTGPEFPSRCAIN